jgi:hypothetical protein
LVYKKIIEISKRCNKFFVKYIDGSNHWGKLYEKSKT